MRAGEGITITQYNDPNCANAVKTLTINNNKKECQNRDGHYFQAECKNGQATANLFTNQKCSGDQKKEIWTLRVCVEVTFLGIMGSQPIMYAMVPKVSKQTRRSAFLPWWLCSLATLLSTKIQQTRGIGISWSWLEMKILEIKTYLVLFLATKFSEW